MSSDIENEDLMADLAADVERLTRQVSILEKVIATDATQAGLIKRLKELDAENVVLRERNAALMDEKNTAIADARRLRLALKRAEEKKE